MLRAKCAPSAEGSFTTGAAPVLLAAKLTNAELAQPLEYGDALVGLSGVYAVINGIRLAVAHKRVLSRADVHMLMAVAFDYLSGRLSPKQAFQSGCRVSLWRGMAGVVVEAARQRLGLHVSCDRLFVEHSHDRHAAFAVIEAAIGRWQPVLMLCRGGRYTVVSGFTASSLLLFDGGGAYWLAKHACGVPGDAENARHLLFPASFMALHA